MKARELVLMLTSVVVASLILKAFPTLKAFVASNSITVRDAKGTPLYDAI
jgi:hypothetical protein